MIYTVKPNDKEVYVIFNFISGDNNMYSKKTYEFSYERNSNSRY